jgi:RNA polymerase sigma-70 factor (ECF subfamily)
VTTPASHGDRSPPGVVDTARENSDVELLREIAAGELGALGALYDRYQLDVLRFVARATGNGPDVDDLVQDAFLTVAKAAVNYDGRPCARPFILGVAAQLIRRRRRSIARFARAITELAFAPTPTTPSPEAETARAKEHARFDAALARLSDDKRLVFLLFEREGLRGEEIASALDIPVNTVWTRLHHARADLRRALDPGGKR